MSTVAIIGASPKPERYANMAQAMLMEAGYEVVPVSKAQKTVLNVETVADLEDYEGYVDTVTLYIGSTRVESVVDSIVRKKPRRVIFNPGTENEAASARLRAAGIDTLQACTLVMLRTGQF